MSDKDAATNSQYLALTEAKKLYGLKPDHELLQYIRNPDDDTLWEAFLERFGNPRVSRQEKVSYHCLAYAYTKYLLSLREACENSEKVIVVNHDPIH